MMNLIITRDAAEAIARYTDVIEEADCADALTAREREEARSYACEALARILRANPDVFDFVGRMEAVKARKAGR